MKMHNQMVVKLQKGKNIATKENGKRESEEVMKKGVGIVKTGKKILLPLKLLKTHEWNNRKKRTNDNNGRRTIENKVSWNSVFGFLERYPDQNQENFFFLFRFTFPSHWLIKIRSNLSIMTISVVVLLL